MTMQRSWPYISLDGRWSLAYSLAQPTQTLRSSADIAAAGLEALPATVPGNVELDLQAAGVIEEPFYGMNMAALRWLERAHLWYWRSFVANTRPGYRAELLFQGLDCYAEIYVNGEWVGSTDNMLVEHILPVEDLLDGKNEILVHIRPTVEEARNHAYPPGAQALRAGYEALHVRKAPHMYGWDIMPRAVSAGIWRPAGLRYQPGEHLEYVYLETQSIAEDHSRARLALHYEAKLGADRRDRDDPADRGHPADGWEIALTGRCGDSHFSQRYRLISGAGALAFDLPHPRLWWPRGRGEPALYDCQASLLENGREIDTLSFRHGIRTVHLERSSVTDPYGNGEFCFHVNGEKVFVLGSNWVPVDAYHSRDAQRIPHIIAMAEEIGCNMFRCWGGNVYENDLFFDLCDEKGIMAWQDFTMACAVYPQDRAFADRLEREARQVVQRLRQHPSLVLWAGDNECDQAYSWGGRRRDPNNNVLTREVLPRVLRDEDPARPYLPSSPYIDQVAFRAGDHFLPENHLWGPRDYYKSDYYRNSLCHFASEIGYHGCPAPASLRRFLSPGKLWPYAENEEWLLHATSSIPGIDLHDYRVELMAKQVRELFGAIPDNLGDFALASQCSQAEACKFFIELFRSHKWRRTGIIWWNLMDGWPQLSDAVVDYYSVRKLAYAFIQRAQAPLCLVLREPANWQQVLVACNDTRGELEIKYTVRDVEGGAIVAQGRACAHRDSVTPLDSIPFSMGCRRFYLLEWSSPLGTGISHYLAGNPPFDLSTYRSWLQRAGLLSDDWLREGGFA